MTNRIGGILALAVALALLAQAQPREDHNGHFWQTLPHDSKVGYLYGYLEGYSNGFAESAVATGVPLEKALDAFKKSSDEITTTAKLTYSDLAKGIDKVYEDPANVVLPIVNALRVFMLRAKGATPEAVERELAMYRRLSTPNR
jgi:hypothetical protein